MGIYHEKKEMRKNILNIREQIKKDTKSKYDNIIREKFINTLYYKNAKKIFIYISYKNEVDTKEIIKAALKDNKEIYVPRTEVETKAMDAVRIKSLENLIADKYGILEPSRDEQAIDPNELDLIIVPGVGFDTNGVRLGYGAGYYDRYFKKIDKKAIKKIALTYEFQILDEVPMGKYDEKIDLLVTEKRMIMVM